jgi:hypothetical protein
MRQSPLIIVAVAVMLSLFAVPAAGDDRYPSNSPSGTGSGGGGTPESQPGYVYATAYSSGSETCGIQEAMDAVAADSPGIVFLPPSDECENITKPIHRNHHVTLRGVGTGHPDQSGTGTRLTADFDALEHSGAGATVDIDLDSIGGATADYAGIRVINNGSLSAQLVVVSAGANTINWVTEPNAFEVGQCIRLEQFTEAASGSQGDHGFDEGGPHCITAIGTTVNANDTLTITDPKDRLAADTTGTVGGSNERVMGVVLTATTNIFAGLDLDPIDVTGTSAGDVPYIFRAKTPADFTCPWGNCSNNDRLWPIVQQISDSKLALDDPNEFAASETGVAIDWVASPCMLWTGQSIMGPADERLKQLRGLGIAGITFNGDGDGDGDGEAACGIWQQPDADHSGSLSWLWREHTRFIHIGNGDTTSSGSDYSHLDTAVVLQGEQGNDTGITSTNDQDDHWLVIKEGIHDTSRGYLLNSKQAVLLKFIDIGCNFVPTICMEIEGGEARVDGYSGSEEDLAGWLDQDAVFYVHTNVAEPPKLSVEKFRIESAAGTPFVVESGKPVHLVIKDGVILLQRQDREDVINYQASGTLFMSGITFQRQSDAWAWDIEAPNATKIVQLGESQIEADGTILDAGDTPVIEDRNFGVLPEGTATCWGTRALSPDSSSDHFAGYAPRPLSVHEIRCGTPPGSGTTIQITPQECSDAMAACGNTEAAITCDDNGATIATANIDDKIIDTGDTFFFDFTAATGSPAYAWIDVCGY